MFAEQVFRQVDRLAEQHRRQRAQCRQDRHPDQQPRLYPRHGHREPRRLHLQEAGDAVGRQGGRQAGKHVRRVQPPHADHGHREHRRRQRRPEQRGEECRHARRRRRAQVPVVQPEHPSRMVADDAAHLQCRALPARGAAGEMGQERTDENRREEPRTDALPRLDFVKDVIGAQSLRPGALVNPHNQQARQRQAVQQPREPLPPVPRQMHGVVERRPRPAAQNPRHHRHRRPA